MGNLGLHRLIVVLQLLVFSIMIGVDAHSKEVENLIRNGDFEEGLIEWDLRQSEGAVATMKEEKGESVKGRSCVYIDIDNVARTDAWHLSLYQEGHLLEEGQLYTLSFWAKAEEPRPVALYVEQAADPWDEYGRVGVEVNEEWREYWTTFTASMDVPVWPRIALGESDVSIWVDNVRFYEGQYVEEEDLKREEAVDPAGKLLITWAGIKRET
jgi:hypothetical protein